MSSHRSLFLLATLGIIQPWLAQPVDAQARKQPLVSPQVDDDRRITFRLFAPKASQVKLLSGDLQASVGAGSTAMTRADDGVWSVTVGPVPPGIYDYTFDVDGLTITDPSSSNVFGNRRGSRGFVEVPGPKGQPRSDEWRDLPHGTVTTHWYNSTISGGRRRFHVYTPPHYGQFPERRYPALYLLHGSGDNDSHWSLLGRANVIADNLLADGKMVPMLIVMPDGHVRERPTGTLDDKTRLELRQAFEKDLLDHVVPLVESNYRVKADAGSRAIAGLSMGSAQSLAVGLGHTDRFTWIGAFSGAISPKDPVVAGLQAGPTNERLRLLWLGMGKDDSGVQAKRDLAAALKDKGIRHEYHETDGAHRWGVWRQYLAEFLPRLFRS